MSSYYIQFKCFQILQNHIAIQTATLTFIIWLLKALKWHDLAMMICNMKTSASICALF